MRYEVNYPAVEGVPEAGEVWLSAVLRIRRSSEGPPAYLAPSREVMHGLVRQAHRGTAADGLRPDWSDGVPGCSGEECPVYDGKRCRALGCRPDSLCRPAVETMARLLGSGA
jgi:hypothetical protein